MNERDKKILAEFRHEIRGVAIDREMLCNILAEILNSQPESECLCIDPVGAPSKYCPTHGNKRRVVEETDKEITMQKITEFEKEYPQGGISNLKYWLVKKESE